MAADPVTPLPGTVTIVAGGAPITTFPGNISGGIIQNPLDSADQGISVAEPIYVDPINPPGSAPGDGNGTTFVIYPGQTWSVIPGQTTPTQVNAATTNHKFSGVYWL
jgi:hypothetical protein